MRALRLLSVFLSLATIVACYQSYTGVYTLRSEDHSESVAHLSGEVAAAIRRFGFREVYRDGSSASFEREPRATDADMANLDGASATIYVSIGTEPSVKVAVRDMTNTKETPFVFALKQSIRAALAGRYGPDAVEFERVRDWTT